MKGLFLKKDRILSIAFLGAALLAALCAAGCSTTAVMEANGKKTWNKEGAPELSTHIFVNNSSLAKGIEVTELKSAMAGNLMKAQVSLRSKDRELLPVLYKFEWLDAQGMEIAANSSAWKPMVIYASEAKSIQGVAPDPRAREFKLKIREPD